MHDTDDEKTRIEQSGQLEGVCKWKPGRTVVINDTCISQKSVVVIAKIEEDVPIAAYRLISAR